MQAHSVYFKLVDDSQAAKEALVANCQKYLAPSAGIIFFGVGMLAEDLARDVNDRDFDVALQIVFKDRAAHDAYQEADSHHQFIEESQSNWQKVRVFDTDLVPYVPPAR